MKKSKQYKEWRQWRLHTARPPEAILSSCSVTHFDQSDFERARWIWQRRPKRPSCTKFWFRLACIFAEPRRPHFYIYICHSHLLTCCLSPRLLPVLFCCSSTVKKNTTGRGGVPTIPGRLIGCSGPHINDRWPFRKSLYKVEVTKLHLIGALCLYFYCPHFVNVDLSMNPLANLIEFTLDRCIRARILSS